MKIPWDIRLAGLVVLALAGIGAVVYGATRDTSVTEESSLSAYSAKILYLSPTNLPAKEQLDKFALPGQAINAVHSFADLKGQADASVRAIIVQANGLWGGGNPIFSIPPKFRSAS